MKLTRNAPWVPGRRLIDHTDILPGHSLFQYVGEVVDALCMAQVVADRAIQDMMLSGRPIPPPSIWNRRSSAIPIKKPGDPE